MNIADTLAQLEREKFKLEANKEYTSTKEKEKLNFIIIDIEKKILYCKVTIETLENEIKQIEIKEKNNEIKITNFNVFLIFLIIIIYLKIIL